MLPLIGLAESKQDPNTIGMVQSLHSLSPAGSKACDTCWETLACKEAGLHRYQPAQAELS